MAARYTPLSHEDSDDESSLQENLLTVSTTSLRHSENYTTWSTTFDLAILLRLASLVMATVAFILLILDGDVSFIAADVFLAFIMILDFSITVHHFISNVLTITIELRDGSWKRDIRGSGKPSVAMYFDIAFTACFTICILVGNGLKRRRGAWIGGAVLGYLVILIHILLAVPSIHKKALTLTLTAKLSQSREQTAPDTTTLVQPMGRNFDSDTGSCSESSRRRPMDNEEPRKPVKDLV